MPKKTPTRQQPKRVPTLTPGRALGPKSPLTDSKVDIQSFLALCMTNWDNFYNDDEKRQIISSLPASVIENSYLNISPEIRIENSSSIETNASTTDIITCPIEPDFIATDIYIKRCIAKFKRDIGDGYYEKSWQDKAKKAMEERKRGDFDKHLAESIEEMFLPEETTTALDRNASGDESTGSEYTKGSSKSKKGNKRSKTGPKTKGKRNDRMIREGSLLRDELALSDTGD